MIGYNKLTLCMIYISSPRTIVYKHETVSVALKFKDQSKKTKLDNNIFDFYISSPRMNDINNILYTRSP